MNNDADAHAKTVQVQGVELTLSIPDQLPFQWIGQNDPMQQLLAAWHQVDEYDLPMSPRLIGKPGVGKTTLAYAAAKKLGREVYIFQATMDTRPEDLLILPVLGEGGHIRYVASPLVTAMIEGGVCILDEGNRMSEKSWASLAPLLDNRRYIESLLAGLKIHAHADFRFCATMNDDASTFEIPEYIHSRLQPQIYLDFPDSAEEKLILQENLPTLPEEILEYVVSFLQQAHAKDLPYTIRDGVNIARYAAKRLACFQSPQHTEALCREAIKMTLGEEATLFLQ